MLTPIQRSVAYNLSALQVCEFISRILTAALIGWQSLAEKLANQVLFLPDRVRHLIQWCPQNQDFRRAIVKRSLKKATVGLDFMQRSKAASSDWAITYGPNSAQD
jgi:hypothetical protein